jgi:CheY-like chemotaxis protein
MVASRDAMAKLLKMHGYETACAMNGAEGLVQLKRSKPDLVLLDHMMPEVDGLTFLAGIRRFPKWKDLPVIMLSGIKDNAQQMKAQTLGVRQYLVKNEFTTTELLDHIEKSLGAQPATAGF